MGQAWIVAIWLLYEVTVAAIDYLNEILKSMKQLCNLAERIIIIITYISCTNAVIIHSTG